MTMHVWLPYTDDADRGRHIGPLPVGVTAEYVTDPHSLPESPGTIDLWVLPNGADAVVFERMSHLPGLQAIQLGSAGFEHVLGRVPQTLRVCNAGGVHDTAVAELAVALALMSLRRLDVFARDQAKGRWAPRSGEGLADKRVLIVGYGRIGAAIERRLLPFEVASVVREANRAKTEPVAVHGADDLPGLLGDADVVFVVTPLTPSTEQLLDARLLALLPDGALIVNVGRGKVIDTAALTAEVLSGRLRCALDVVDPEPLPADHPLWTASGAVIVPHIGGASTSFEPRMDALIARQLRHLAAGEPLENTVHGG